jgi:hypothetical protein
MKSCNENIKKALAASASLMDLADKGDMDREDNGCGVLYGVVRDAAYKIREQAEKEKKNHIQLNKWL